MVERLGPHLPGDRVAVGLAIFWLMAWASGRHEPADAFVADESSTA
jgi:hypothetical protein